MSGKAERGIDRRNVVKDGHGENASGVEGKEDRKVDRWIGEYVDR